MHELNVENRRIEGSNILSKDLAQHILGRYQSGKIAVVTNNPVALMSSVRKEWFRFIRRTARERSSTLNPRRLELDDLLVYLQSITFTAKPPVDDLWANVNFATVEQLLQAPPMCATLYIASPTKIIDRHMLASWMPRNGVVVVYEQR
jgi:hypothetical protein